MKIYFTLVLAIAAGAGYIGFANDQTGVIFFAVMVLVVGGVFGTTLYSIEMAEESSQDDHSGFTGKICVLCGGGPDNPNSPTCRCGHELWDIDPYEPTE